MNNNCQGNNAIRERALQQCNKTIFDFSFGRIANVNRNAAQRVEPWSHHIIMQVCIISGEAQATLSCSARRHAIVAVACCASRAVDGDVRMRAPLGFEFDLINTTLTWHTWVYFCPCISHLTRAHEAHSPTFTLQVAFFFFFVFCWEGSFLVPLFICAWQQSHATGRSGSCAGFL